ncbi:hypothetical protein QUB80_21020 [Chlorogloeopsis sp. ULAP01]|uniref:hypothetical protein n=1 Tax=Chlorogloeopsis sp. ULAP01 TaxID=3056483 RepID=UPI0025AB0B33|nr:hypothetical protein [Chlorogloeopsis sp. ULAP01]MDM9383180.1 hypothetical protein [Chlorogloeopsis sp. ULAP01]
MKFRLNLSSQNIKHLFPVALKVYLPTLIFIILVWCLSKIFNISMYELTADPAEVVGKPPYTGLFSNIGIVLWSCTAAICIFSAFLTKFNQSCFKKWFNFLLASFFLTSFLLLDDLFQLHETYPVLFFGVDANLPENNRSLQNLLEGLFFIVYFIYVFLYLFYFRKQIRQTEYQFLALAFIFFFLSIAVDMNSMIKIGHDIIEESFKLFGIITWLIYFSKTCSSIVLQLAGNLAVHPQKT